MTKKSIVFIDKRLYNCLYQDAVGDFENLKVNYNVRLIQFR